MHPGSRYTNTDLEALYSNLAKCFAFEFARSSVESMCLRRRTAGLPFANKYDEKLTFKIIVNTEQQLSRCPKTRATITKHFQFAEV